MATIGSLSVGASVYMDVDGKKTEFLIVNQGKPSSIYDASCDGTWLLTKDVYEQRAFDASTNAYENSEIHAYLNGAFLQKFSPEIQSAIKQVKIPYVKGTSYNGSVSSGANGLSTKIFLLSFAEYGYNGTPGSKGDGSELGYFAGTADTKGDAKRTAYLNGTLTPYWSRTKNNVSGRVNCTGYEDLSSWGGGALVSASRGVRPALVLSPDLSVDPNTNEVLTTPPDPMAPHDGHNTNIGQVARQIEAGMVRLNGVAREIENGQVLSGGVAREIAFSNLPPVGTALNDCSWEEIAAISEAGMASNYWKVGDTKTITINGKAGATTFSNLSVDVVIIGFDHNSAKEGTNLIHFQIGKIGGKDVCLCDSNYNSQQAASGKFAMNTSNTNSGGWNNSHMRKTVLGSNSASATSPTANTLLAALPADLRAVMKPATKYSDNTGGGNDTASHVTATTDYLWLLSEFEVHGSRSYANSAEQNSQAQYDYYKAGNSKVKNKHDATTTAANWWLRSVYAADSDSFCLVYTGGRAAHYAYFSYGVAPGFAV